jgi:hypothetical protein
LDEAAATYRETIAEWQHLGNRGAVAHQLESMAFLAGAREDAERAVRLLGAADELRQLANAVMLSGEREEYDRAIEAFRTRLAPDAFAAAWWDGTAMSLEMAVALALS